MQAAHHVTDGHHGHSNHHSGCSCHTFTHLTYSRHHLIDIAMETIKIAENGHYTTLKEKVVHVKKDLDWAVEHCVHYPHEFDFDKALRNYDSQGSDDNHYATTGTDHHHNVKCGGNNHHHRHQYGEGIPESLPPTRFQRTSFLVVSASWLEAASELLLASTPHRSYLKDILPYEDASFSCRDASPNSHNTLSRPSSPPTNNHNDNSQHIRVGVLNSASGTTPGGRFLKGTVSQEDCLCRASLLYSCISQPKLQSEGRFYGKNRSFKYGTSNCVIFSPDVPVIREDTVEGKLLDNYQKVSFVTIPAPNAFTTSSTTGKEYNDLESEERPKGLNRNVSEFKLSSLESPTNADETFEKKWRALRSSVSDRIHRALSAFVLGHCTDLVLPAFGCGVHGNDPSMVASVFREMLTDPNQFGGRFRTVVFAIPPSRKQNYQEFAAYFQRKDAEPHQQGKDSMQKHSLMRANSVQ